MWRLPSTLVILLFTVGTIIAAPPNVVVFLADDQGWGDLSLHGNTQLATPSIDSLARDGAELKCFYVCSVCAPTRAEFLTGRWYPRTGVRGVSTGQERLNRDEVTLADLFARAGYATACFGKWHNGSQWPYHPLARGFREYYGFTAGHWGEYFDPPLDHNGSPTRGSGFIADDLTDRAIEFINQHRDRPFFCYLPYNTPHSPFAVPAKYWQRHRDQRLTQLAGDNDLDQTRCVLAMCENLDDNVGRVLNRLRELKLTDNTIVLYFSDNGPNTPRYNGGMKGRKGSVDEGGLRVPCLIRWPARIKPGRVIEPIAGAVDLLPTLCALTGVDRQGTKPLDGVDLSAILTGKEQEQIDRQLFSAQGKALSVRTPRWRWTSNGGLFDLQTDPGQTRDVSRDEPETARSLSLAAGRWRDEVFVGTPESSGPFPVGYREFPRTELPARDGVPHGEVKRSANAPNCSYFVNWKRSEDSITWHVNVHTTGRYRVELAYTCPPTDTGATIELIGNAGRSIGKVLPGWDPPLYDNQDTIARPAVESRMKEFRPLSLPEIELSAGEQTLTLRAIEIPGRTVMDLYSLTLTLLPIAAR